MVGIGFSSLLLASEELLSAEDAEEAEEACDDALDEPLEDTGFVGFSGMASPVVTSP